MSLFDWIGRILILLLLLLVGAVYGRGWSLRRRESNPPSVAQLISFFAGLALIGLSLFSALESLVAQYMTARVVQHVLLTGLAPLLLLAANPFDTWVVGAGKRLVGSLHKAGGRPRLRQAIVTMTAPGIVWMAFVVTFWLWHDAAMIRAAGRSTFVHAVEVLSLLLTACFYWWHIAAARPHLHRPLPQVVRIVYAFAGMLPIKLTGFVMLFGAETMAGGGPVRAVDELTVTLGNLTLPDYSMAAIVLWILGGVTYTYSATFLAGRWLEDEDSKPPLPISILEREDIWIAPGMRGYRPPPKARPELPQQSGQ